jgi:hypothetical protein
MFFEDDLVVFRKDETAADDAGIGQLFLVRGSERGEFVCLGLGHDGGEEDQDDEYYFHQMVEGLSGLNLWISISWEPRV